MSRRPQIPSLLAIAFAAATFAPQAVSQDVVAEAATTKTLPSKVFTGRAERRLLPKEAELLSHLLRHRGQACTRDDLLRAVWGYDATPTTRTVDTHIFQLRQKLEQDPSKPKWLLTVHGVGYRLREN